MLFGNRPVGKILYGGDYNPEQWPEEIWQEDMRLFREAGIDTVTLNVFSWAELQPDEETWNFRKLDRIMEMVRRNHLHVVMATSTAVHPAWMAKRYPDVLRTDCHGTKRKYGQRHNSCPNSPSYRKFAGELAGRLAQHCRSEDSILAWHVSNEYGGECFCENCEKAFRLWLQKKYGTLDALNEAWYTSFWSHTFYDWDEIVVPNERSECDAGDLSRYPVISIDYSRFMSDSLLACFMLERDAIKKEIPDARVTTNLMGFYPGLDYQKWAKEMDFISWDSYPSNSDYWTDISMPHDLMRSIGGGRPFALMEQTPSTAAWRPYNELKRPGVMRLWSYQAAAHGADTIQFFQMRQSRGGYEQFHGAVIDHSGTDRTRVFRETAALGKELQKLGAATLGGRTPSGAGIFFTWDNWWAVSRMSGPSGDFDCLAEVRRTYRALRELNIDVDFLSPEDDLSGYRVIFAPAFFMVRGNVKRTAGNSGQDGGTFDEGEAVRDFVRRGGTFVATFQSGIVDENDQAVPGGRPGKLRDVLGIWAEESDGLLPGMHNAFSFRGKEYPADIICDLIHLETAVRIDDGGYQRDFYQGMPVVTENHYGNGTAFYIATASSPAFYRTLYREICGRAEIAPVLETPDGVEAASRTGRDGTLVYLLNHTEMKQEIRLPWKADDLLNGEAGPETCLLEPHGVSILRRKE